MFEDALYNVETARVSCNIIRKINKKQNCLFDSMMKCALNRIKSYITLEKLNIKYLTAAAVKTQFILVCNVAIFYRK